MRPLRAAVAAITLLLAGCASQPPLPAAGNVELSRYMGTWYVIGAVPNLFERGKVATDDTYRLRPDGRIEVTYHWRRTLDGSVHAWHGIAWLPDPAEPARWKVQLLWPFRSDYVIVALDPDRAALVGLPSRKLFWIMARDRQLPDATYRQLLQVAERNGFPVGQAQRVPQPAGQGR